MEASQGLNLPKELLKYMMANMSFFPTLYVLLYNSVYLRMYGTSFFPSDQDSTEVYLSSADMLHQVINN